MAGKSTTDSRSSTPGSACQVSWPELVDESDAETHVSDSDGSESDDDTGSAIKQGLLLPDNQYNDSPSPSPRRAPVRRTKPDPHRSSSPKLKDDVEETVEVIDLTRSECDPNESEHHDESCKIPRPSPSPSNETPSPKKYRRKASPSKESPPLSIEKLENNIKDIVLTRYEIGGKRKAGYAYIFADPMGKTGLFKIGSAQDWETRRDQHQKSCQPTWNLQHIPYTRLREYIHLEKLAQAELKNLKTNADCPCLTGHREYYRGSTKMAREILECWAKWLQDHSPFDEGYNLYPFWHERLEMLGSEKLDHIKCPKTECQKATDIRSSSCQACLRLRLKFWTEATRRQKLIYEIRAIRTEIISRFESSWNFVCNPIMHLGIIFLAYFTFFAISLSSKNTQDINQIYTICGILPLVCFTRVWCVLSKESANPQSLESPMKVRSPGKDSPKKSAKSPTSASPRNLQTDVETPPNNKAVLPRRARSKSINTSTGDTPEKEDNPRPETLCNSSTDAVNTLLTPQRAKAGAKRRKSHH